MIGLGGDIDGARCSRAGCAADATNRIDWRNPRIHDETRTKTWLGCDEHAGFLAEFLRARDFPVRVTAIAEADA